MPTGEPLPGDEGMDGTTAHGRLYWGGATFWLLAEVAIHDQSQGRRSLREALRAVNRASGGNRARWSPEQLMRAGDLATGTQALSTLYARFATSRVETDLPALFRRLGVMVQPDGGVGFDDGAPLAALRRSITQA
jgi:predicted metalloprotease with PDZ domain